MHYEIESLQRCQTLDILINTQSWIVTRFVDFLIINIKAVHNHSRYNNKQEQMTILIRFFENFIPQSYSVGFNYVFDIPRIGASHFFIVLSLIIQTRFYFLTFQLWKTDMKLDPDRCQSIHFISCHHQWCILAFNINN